MTRQVISGTLLDERVVYSLEEVCQVCGSRTEWVVELVDEGILEPTGNRRRDWCFPGSSVHVAMKARRLQQDLGLNLSGVALVLDLLDEIEKLRSQISMLESD
jgi:chaperone modulatory protein CbpM